MLKHLNTNRFAKGALRFVIFTLTFVVLLTLQGTPLSRAFLTASVGGVVFAGSLELITLFRK
ncbi:hypothetical protein FM036_04435 [Nostoc sp. HG1]|nr:hypothetical protein [Nostoc sp. HG1]